MDNKFVVCGAASAAFLTFLISVYRSNVEILWTAFKENVKVAVFYQKTTCVVDQFTYNRAIVSFSVRQNSIQIGCLNEQRIVVWHWSLWLVGLFANLLESGAGRAIDRNCGPPHGMVAGVRGVVAGIQKTVALAENGP